MSAAPPWAVSPEPMPMSPRVRPTGVSILAVVAYVSAGFLALAAIGSVLFGTLFGSLLGSLAGRGGAAAGGAVGMAIALFFAFFLLVGAVISGLTGFGLWNGRGWGRILGIVWGALWALSGLSNLAQKQFSGLVSMALGGLILWYLFQPGVKRWFGQAP